MGERTYWWGWGTRELSHNINIENGKWKKNILEILLFISPAELPQIPLEPTAGFSPCHQYTSLALFKPPGPLPQFPRLTA